MAARKHYYLVHLVPVPRQAVIAAARASNHVAYAVSEGDTETGHRLNWIGELPGDEGWAQGVMTDQDGNDLVLMHVSR